MSAHSVECRQRDDEPVPYTLTTRGEAATRTLLTTVEAAALLNVDPSWITRLARRGRIAGVKVGAQLLLDASSVRDYAPKRQPARRARGHAPSVPAEPFLRLLDSRGGAAACGVERSSAEEKAIERARRTGVLTEVMADRLTVQLLGLTMWEVWGG